MSSLFRSACVVACFFLGLEEALARTGDFALSAEAFQDAVLRSPKSEGPWRTYADFDLERFRVLDLQLRASQRGMAAVLRVQAETLSRGTQDGAPHREELLRRSALADPEQSGIWGELGSEQLRLGIRKEAAASLKTAKERQPQDLWTLRLETRMAAAQGDWREAETRLLDSAHGRWKQLAALPPPRSEDAPAWFQRGVAEAELSDCAAAIPALERGLDFGEAAAAFWLELCYASEAERSVRHLAALGYGATMHRLRGDMLVRIMGDPKGATKEYREAIRLDPKEPVLLERLAQAYFACGDLPPARAAAEKVLLLDPNRPLTLRLLASLAMKERDYPGALVFLRKLLYIDPKNPWITVHMGIAYAETGRPEEAVRDLEPALAAGYPDERGALHAILAGALGKLGRGQEAQRAADESERLADRFQEGVRNGSDDDQ